jgi:hypothetical protein
MFAAGDDREMFAAGDDREADKLGTFVASLAAKSDNSHLATGQAVITAGTINGGSVLQGHERGQLK